MGNKRQRFLYKTSPPVQYEYGNCRDAACFQFFADLRVFMSLRHTFPGFSVEIKCKPVFWLEPLCNRSVWPQGGTPAMFNRGLRGCISSSLIPLPAPLRREQQPGELSAAGHEPKASTARREDTEAPLKSLRIYLQMMMIIWMCVLYGGSRTMYMYISNDVQLKTFTGGFTSQFVMKHFLSHLTNLKN